MTMLENNNMMQIMTDKLQDASMPRKAPAKKVAKKVRSSCDIA